MKIAIASSGLGHVARGIEAWALDLADALRCYVAEQADSADIDVTLFAAELCCNRLLADDRPRYGGDGTRRERPDAEIRRPHVATATQVKPATCNRQRIPCFKRGGRTARALTRLTPGFAWRWGLKTAYGWEQFTFWLHLAPRLKRGGYDILHVQDPMLAYWCRVWRQRGWLTTREILAHGTEEPPGFLAKFEFVQHLAPWHLEATGVAENRLDRQD